MEKKLVLFPIVLLLLSCGSETTGGGTSTAKTITIGSGNAFATTSLNAGAGDTITVTNNDNTTHTVTSQSAIDKFDSSGSFDTGNVSGGGGTGSFVIPTTASVGSRLFYYCNIHKGNMSPSSGTITIVAK